MARNRKEIPLIPPPFSFGALCSDQIMQSEINKLSQEIVADHLKSVVCSTDQNVAVYIITQLFNKITSSDQKEKQKLILLANSFIDKIKTFHWFRAIVIKTFNRMTAFPTKAIKELNYIDALHILVNSFSSKYSKESLKVLQEDVLPKIVVSDEGKITEDVIFELCEINVEGFDIKEVFSAPESPAFSVFIPMTPSQFENRKTETVNSFHSIPIQSVLAESNPSLISSRSRLCELFSFYPDFSEKQAAPFIISLVLPQFHFLEYIEKLNEEDRTKLFQMHKSIFEERGLTVQSIIKQFMFLDIQPLQRDSCNILFAFLACMADGKPIDVMPFVQKWKNPKFQKSILLHFSMNNVPCIDFSRSQTQANIDAFIPSPTVFASSCNCWKSMDFIKCIIELHGNDVDALEKFFEPLISKYPSVILAIFARTDIESTSSISKISATALGSLLQDPLAKQAVNNLWTSSTNFIKQLLLYLYKEKPAIIDRIYETFSDHISELIESKDIRFATDCAIIAATNNAISIGTFVENYMKKYEPESLLRITNFITQKVSTMNQAQISVATEFFTYLSEKCNKYPIQQQFFISKAAKAATEEQPSLTISNIEVKVPQRLLQDAKERASNLFNHLISGKEEAASFSQKLSNFKFTDPILFEEVVELITSKFQDIESMNSAEIKELAQVAGKLVTSHDLSKNQTFKILGIIKKALDNEQQSPLYEFGECALEGIIPDISNYPQFIYDVMRETRIRDHSPKLFEQIQKIGQKINEPYHSSLPKSITVHPKLLRFNNLKKPSPKLARELVTLQADPTKLLVVLQNNPQGYDWIALTVVDTIQDNPALLPAFIPYLHSSGDFLSIVFQAAASRSLQHILSSDFDKYEGCLRRRRLIILGRLIGGITLGIKRPILSRFLDLKKLLLYGISQGKLYGIVPFVTTIMSNASDFFKPPNPFSSGILYIMVGIISMNSIKMYIKQQILGLFSQIGITPAMFDKVPKYFPSVIEGNYDFLITPFSLLHFLSTPDIEKITAIDDTILNQLIQQYVIIPENVHVTHEDKERMKMTIAKVASNLIHNDGVNAAKTASSTTIELVKKDFKSASQPELMIEPAYEMVRQLAASLTLFTAPMKLSRNLTNQIKGAANGFDSWADEIAVKNYEWISQLLRDFVCLRALNIVKEELRKIIEEEKSKRSKNIATSGFGGNACIQAQQVYADYLELSLSQQQFPIAEITQTKDKHVMIDQQFDEYISSFGKYVPFDQSYNENQADDSAVKALLAKCPNFSIIPINYQHFQSIMKTILKCASRNPSRPFEIVLCQVLEKVVISTPPHLITAVKPYVLTWVRNLLPAYIVCDLVRLGLVDQKELDKEFTGLINNEPFNTKVMLHIMQTLYYGMVETSKLNAREMISSLTAVCTINASQLDISKESSSTRYTQYIKNLAKVFETIYAPENGIPMNTKLQKFCVYDAMENLSVGKASNAVSRWRNAYAENETTEMMEETREVVAYSSSAMAALFFTEKQSACEAFMQAFSKIPTQVLSVNDILEAVAQNLRGCARVIGADTSKYYYIARSAISILHDSKTLDNFDRYEQVAKTLHSLRPSEIPSFTFSWIQLISDKIFAVPLLSNEQHYASYFILLADFIAAVSNIDEECDAFEKAYKALLRLILIIRHDYENFLSSCSTLLLQIIPFKFTQIRNLLLSLDPKPNSVFEKATLNLQVTDKFSSLLSQFITAPQVKDAQTIASMLKDNGKEKMSYVFHLVNAIIQNTKADSSDSITMQALISILEQCDSKLTLCIINAILDNIRNCPLLQQATKIANILIRSDAQNTHKFTVSEMTMRAIIERLTSSSQAPKALVQLFINTINENERTNFLSEKNYIKCNPVIADFLSSQKAELSKQTL